jgi:hypothetical protein
LKRLKALIAEEDWMREQIERISKIPRGAAAFDAARRSTYCTPAVLLSQDDWIRTQIVTAWEEGNKRSGRRRRKQTRKQTSEERNQSEEQRRNNFIKKVAERIWENLLRAEAANAQTANAGVATLADRDSSAQNNNALASTGTTRVRGQNNNDGENRIRNNEIAVANQPNTNTTTANQPNIDTWTANIVKCELILAFAFLVVTILNSFECQDSMNKLGDAQFCRDVPGFGMGGVGIGFGMDGVGMDGVNNFGVKNFGSTFDNEVSADNTYVNEEANINTHAQFGTGPQISEGPEIYEISGEEGMGEEENTQKDASTDNKKRNSNKRVDDVVSIDDLTREFQRLGLGRPW